jgi:hypothetical protein
MGNCGLKSKEEYAEGEATLQGSSEEEAIHAGGVLGLAW